MPFSILCARKQAPLQRSLHTLFAKRVLPDPQNNFANMTTAFHTCMRSGSIGEVKFAIHHRPQTPGIQQRPNLFTQRIRDPRLGKVTLRAARDAKRKHEDEDKIRLMCVRMYTPMHTHTCKLTPHPDSHTQLHLCKHHAAAEAPVHAHAKTRTSTRMRTCTRPSRCTCTYT